MNSVVALRPTPGLASTPVPRPSVEAESDAQIVLPGAGVLLVWQLGAMSYLAEKYDLSRVKLTGSSAGAITAAVAASRIDFNLFVEKIIHQCNEKKVWNRPLGIVGVLGCIVHDALEEVLPMDAADKLERNKVTVLVTKTNKSLTTEKVSTFGSRQVVVDALKASSHIPYIVNGKATATFREARYIDGSLFASQSDYVDDREALPVLRVDHNDDPVMKHTTMLDCLETLTEERIWELYMQGRRYAEIRSKNGDYDYLTERRREPKDAGGFWTFRQLTGTSDASIEWQIGRGLYRLFLVPK